MFKKSDKPILKSLSDVDNLDAEYISTQEAYKTLGFGRNNLKYYIATYKLTNEARTILYNKNKNKTTLYHKKEDVRVVTKLREKTDLMINLMPILNVNCSKTLKSFFDRYEIRYLSIGTHPFGKCHMYYKEDLKTIKEKFTRHKEAYSGVFSANEQLKNTNRPDATKQLKDIENLDTKYIAYEQACATLGSTKELLKHFVTCYELKEEKTHAYCKREHISALAEYKAKLDKVANIKLILGVKGNTSFKRFLNKYEIKFLPVGTHPFGRCIMYYKEDLALIKEKYPIYCLEVQKVIERFQGGKKEDSKSRLGTGARYKKYNDKAINIEHFDRTEYYGRQEAIDIFKKCGFNKPQLYNAMQPYIYNKRIYLKKSDVKYWIDKSNDLVKINDAVKMIGYQSANGLVDFLKKFDIPILSTLEHPYGSIRLIYKKDIEKAIEIDKSLGNLDDYMSMSEVEILFGVKTNYKRIERFVEPPITIRGAYYFKKKDIYELNKYITDTISLDVLVQKYIGKIGRQTIVALLKNNNIRIISHKEHPFLTGVLIFKKDLKKINDILDLKLKLDSSENRKEKFELLISQIPKKECIKETLEDFCKKFVVKRFNNKSRDTTLHVPLYNTYTLLCDMLQKNLHEYSDEDIQRLISMVYNDERINNNVKLEFVYFCNFTNKKYKENTLPYKLNQSDLVKNHKEKISYSREQLLDLFRLLHSSLNDRVYLKKALDNRRYAMIWLYMYMHYVVFWRASTLKDIPKPNLKVIGFNSGGEFLNWCKEPSNIFTEDMGMKICTSVKVQIDSLGITAKKNGQPLVFEYGKLMSRGLGLLLAICEAHRECVEEAKFQRNDRLYRRYDTYRLITSNHATLDNYKGLFGEKYTNIFGEEVFSNLAMERAFNNYTLDYSEENNNAIGTHILSIMRSHVVDVNGVSNITPIYETRVKEGTIGDIVATLEEIGAFGFAKHALLTICDKEYEESKLIDKNKKIMDLTITPNQAEGLVRTVADQRQHVTNLLMKMIVNPDTTKMVLKELAFGNDVAGKHEHSRCLLKAILNLHNDKIDEKIYALDLGTDEEIRVNCLMPSAGNCFSCPLLIGQIFLLNELNDVISDAINTIKSSKNDFEKLLQSTLIFESYFPILYEAQDVLSNDMVSNYIDLDSICNDLTELESEGKLLLKE